jgi:predicted  nucleic acid-binding Zn-ribbon protein
MSALDLQNKLETVNDRLQDFFNAYRDMRLDLENLKKENSDLKRKLESRTEEMQDFQNKRKIGKLVDEMNGEEVDTTELKKLLDRYIGEIDQCIESLKE